MFLRAGTMYLTKAIAMRYILTKLRSGYPLMTTTYLKVLILWTRLNNMQGNATKEILGHIPITTGV